MALIDLLLAEHGIVGALFDHLESELHDASPAESIQRAARALAITLSALAEMEEGMLFPALEPHIATAGPLFVMRSEHGAVTRALAAVADSRSREEAVGRARTAVLAGREHFAREERVVFDIAQRSLPQKELKWLAACRT